MKKASILRDNMREVSTIRESAPIAVTCFQWTLSAHDCVYFSNYLWTFSFSIIGHVEDDGSRVLFLLRWTGQFEYVLLSVSCLVMSSSPALTMQSSIFYNMFDLQEASLPGWGHNGVRTPRASGGLWTGL
jgi:hypothetical protein